MASQRLTIRLPDHLQWQLEGLTHRTGQTESEIVRAALSEYCRRHEAEPTCYDVAKKAGFIGCVEGGPDDLSVDPSQMEGFGRD